ncbi:MAG: bacterial Ig-like domain-containing protein, partial [Clostridiales bacterium]|nr:bacterial Ig-like domain-containing protein [Clostridiales bacterium]
MLFKLPLVVMLILQLAASPLLALVEEPLPESLFSVYPEADNPGLSEALPDGNPDYHDEDTDYPSLVPLDDEVVDRFISLLTEPEDIHTIEGAVAGSLFVEALGFESELTFQWFEGAFATDRSGLLIEGATKSMFDIPPDLDAGTYYYYCIVSAEDAVSAISIAAIVTVEPPKYIRYIDSIPDANFRSFVLSYLNWDGGRRTDDSPITDADIATLAVISQLVLSDMGIADLTGIQLFTGLQVLDCRGNFLTSLDLSYNPNLSSLYCANNQLTGLDVSANLVLNRLICNNNDMASPDDVIGWEAIGLMINSPDNLGSGSFHFYNQRGVIEKPQIKITAQPVNGTMGLINGRLDYSCILSVAAEINSGDKLYYQWYWLTGEAPDPNADIPVGAEASLEVTPELVDFQYQWLYTFYCVIHADSAESVISDIAEVELTEIMMCPDTSFFLQPEAMTIVTEGAISGSLYAEAVTYKVDVAYQWFRTDTPDDYYYATPIAGATSPEFVIPEDLTADGSPYYFYCRAAGWVDVDISELATVVVEPKKTDFITYAEAFPDANFCAAVLKLINAGDEINRTEDSPLTEEDQRFLAAVEELDLFKLNITDLTGLPYFSGMIRFSCAGNQLTKLDVRPFTALEWLSCHENQLTDLDVSQNTALERLTCYDNRLETLILTENAALQVLYCYNNRLEMLYLTDNPLLSELACNNNRIQWLDVSQNPSLLSLYCDDNLLLDLDITQNTALLNLSCSNNILTDLDVSQNSALRTIDCSGNLLYELDVTQNPLLSDLLCADNRLVKLDVSNSTGLAYIDCSNNLLEELDVSQNAALLYLYCFENRLTGLELAKSDTIWRLYCYNNYMTSPDDVIGWQTKNNLVINSPGNLNSGTFRYFNQKSGVIRPSIIIRSQPEDLLILIQDEITSPDTLTIDAIANPDAELTYAWYQLLGEEPNPATDRFMATGASFSVAPLLSSYPYGGLFYFYCVVGAENADSVISRVAYVYITYVFVDPGVEIVTQPEANTTVTEGEIEGSLYIHAKPIGNTTVSYQWYRNTSASNTGGMRIEGATSPEFMIPADLTADGSPYYYYCVASGGIDSPASEVATVTVVTKSTFTTIEIITQPLSGRLRIINGRLDYSYILYVEAEADNGATLQYQWFYRSGSAPNPGYDRLVGSEADLEISIELLSGFSHLQSYDFYCIVSAEGADSVTSSAANINVVDTTMYPDTFFLLQPAAETVVTEGFISGSLYAEAWTYKVDVEYQWYSMLSADPASGITPIEGATSPSFRIPADLAADGSPYYFLCGASGWTEVIFSNPAVVVVKPEPGQITYEAAFPDVNFRDAVIALLNTDGGDRAGDSVISEDDLMRMARMTELHISNQRIADLTGIAYFPSLLTLDCSNNQLTALDVSQNAGLRILSCQFNAITELDLSSNPALLVLNCNNNRLVSLILTQNRALLSLNCAGNNLAKLDLTGVLDLSVLFCQENDLTALNLTNNASLMHLECWDNPLTDLDLSGNPYLTTLICGRFDSGEGFLTELDVSQNKELVYIWCSGNQLSSLDVSQNTKLNRLFCNDNYIASPDDVKGWQEIGLEINSPESLNAGTFRYYNQKETIAKPVITILSQPEDKVLIYQDGILVGTDDLHITAEATLGAELTYTWYLLLGEEPDPTKDEAVITGADISLTQLLSPAVAEIYYFYCVVAAEGADNVISRVVEVTILGSITGPDVQIIAQPAENTVVTEGEIEGSLCIDAIPIGTDTVFFQWYINTVASNEGGSPIYSSPTSSDFPIPTNLTADGSPYYFYCEASVGSTSKFSDVAIVTVLPAKTGVTYAEAFPDANFREAVLGLLNADGGDRTGESHLSEADRAWMAGLEELEIFNRSIADMTGLAYFTGLSYLHCSDNQLTELDVTQNTELEYLNCWNNLLVELDVSQNTALRILDVGDNLLTELDLSNNAMLVNLYCDYNLLAELDVSQNTELENLDCRNNLLAELDVSQNTELENLNCSNNLLAELDVNQNTELENLVCSNNLLTELDVSQNTALRSLDVDDNLLTELDVSQNPDLKYLHCSGNMLTGLDFTLNPALEDLFCDDNLLTELDVSQNPYLQYLCCSGNMLTGLNVTQNPFLWILYCLDNLLTELDVTQNPFLWKLYCSNNLLTELDVTQNTELEYLDCSNNLLTELDVTNNPSFWELYCYDNYMTSLDDVAGWQALGLKINSPDNLDSGDFRFYNQKSSIVEPIITILSQPEDLTVNFQDGILIGSDTLSIAAEVKPETELTYTWYQRLGEDPDPAKDRPVGNETSLAISPLLPEGLAIGFYYYYCVVGAENAIDVTSRVAEVFVAHAITDPGVQILAHPAENTVVTEGEIGGSLCIDAIPIGTDTVYFQWYSNTVASNKGGTPIYGATSPDFAIPADLTADGSPYYFYCEASVVFTSEFSDVAMVTVLPQKGELTYAEAFPDDNFRAAVLELLNADGGDRTGESLLSETDRAWMAGLEVLDVSDRSIADMTGLAYFTGLWDLNCSGNFLTELDVTQNTALEYIYCWNNQLAELDVTQNTALVYLDCWSNLLAELDVRQNTALLVLDAGDNLLTELDVRQNTDLMRLYCDNNLLTELDVSQNSDLQFLYCSGNMLTGLDVTLNPALEDLYCENNLLTELDVTQNPDLQYLYCAGNMLTGLDVTLNSALEDLYCENNLLTELDVRQNTGLMHLYCNGNLLTELDVRQNTELEFLDCSNNLLTELDVTNKPYLNMLYCYDNYMTSLDDVAGWQALGLKINSPDNPDSGDFRFYNQKSGIVDPIITILSQPEEMEVRFTDGKPNGEYSLHIAAEVTADIELHYFWYQLLGALPDPAVDTLVGTDADLLLTPLVAQEPAALYFYCVVTAEGAASVTSRVVEVEVVIITSDPGVKILTHPAENTIVTEGAIQESLFIEAIPLGDAIVYYQWYSHPIALNTGGTPIVGATSPTFAIPTDLTAEDSPYYFYCEASVIFTNEFSLVATVTVLPPKEGITFEEAFPDDNFRAAVLELLNADGGDRTGESLLSEADRAWMAALTELNVSYRTIADLTGIAYFTSLETLNCRNNLLTSLDVTQNTNLVNLSCQENALTALDLSAAPALAVLNCFSNQLAELDLSNNPALVRLNCTDNALTKLDVTGNTALTYLNCQENDIAALNVTNNTALTYLECWNNPLTELDVSQNTALTVLICGRFDGGEGLLTELDVSQNTELIQLECWGELTELDLSQNTKLVRLHCGGNLLTSLDLSNNPELQVVYCGDNLLTELDLSHNAMLFELYCANNLLTKIDLSGSPALQLLSCGGNKLEDLDVSATPALAFLWCSDNQLASLDVTVLPALVQLYCQGNRLTALDVTMNPELDWLFCYNNQLTGLDVSHSATAGLTRLYCYNNYMTSPDDVIGWNLHSYLQSINSPGNLESGNFRYYNQLDPSVEPGVIITIQPAPETIVTEGEILESLYIETIPIGNAQISYQWYRNDNPSNSGGTPIEGAQASVFAIPADLTAGGSPYYFYCVATGGTSHDVSDIAMVTVVLPQVSLTYAEAFPDANFREAVLEIVNDADDGDRTGASAVSAGDIAFLAGIEVLDVSGRGIADLTGIAYFPGLVALDCKDNVLTALNLSPLVNLEDLNCNLNQLTSLDLTMLPTLLSVTCNRNLLTEIHVAGLENLATLGCGSNQIGTLDLSGLSSLENLFCDNNLLTDLNLSGLDALEAVWCYNNRLTGLDLRETPGIGWLACYENDMVSPDSVLGWEDLDLIINKTDDLNTGTFLFHNQRTTSVVVELTEIAVTTPPAVIEYIQGEALSLAGMVVTAHYSDGSEATVTGYTAEPAEGTILDSLGDVTVTLRYTEGVVTGTAAFLVHVEPAPVAVILDSISISTYPQQTEYTLGDALSLAGMVVTAHYSDGSTSPVTGFSTDVEAGTILDTPGTQTVTVSYTEDGITVTASFSIMVDVAVADPVLDGVSIGAYPTKTSYIAGERLDLSGLSIIA